MTILKKIDNIKINKSIEAEKIRLIDYDGEMLGLISLNKSLKMAKEKGYDLVEISPNTKPPV